MARLEIHSEERRRVFQILDKEFEIGGDPGLSLRLRGEHLRPIHVRCRLLESGLFVEPAPGVPRLLVNGKPTQGATLTHGDRLGVGTFLLVFCDDDAPPPIVKASWIPDEAAAEAALAEEDRGSSTGLALDIRLPGSERAERVPSRVRNADVDPLQKPTKAPSPAGSGVSGAGASRPGTPKASPKTSPKAPLRSRAESSPSGGRRTSVSRRNPAASGNNKAILWTVGVVLVAGVLLILQSTGGPSGMGADENLVALAERQWRSGDQESAFRTLAMAEKGASAAELELIQVRRGLWQSQMLRAEDFQEIEQARSGHRVATRFGSTFFEQATDKRPPARELVRQCEAWLASFSGLSEKHEEVAALREDIRSLLELGRPHAELPEPDTAEDLLFRVDYWTRFENRRYREALDALNAWLAERGPEAEGVRAVRKERETLLTEGKAWVDRRRRVAESAHRAGDLRSAVSILRFLVSGGVPSDWLTSEASLLQSYEAEFSGR